MNGAELLEKSRELVDEIYGCMTKIEKCEGIAEEIKDKPFVFIKTDENGSETGIYLDDVLSERQIQNLRSIIVTSVICGKEEAEKRLNELLGTKEEIPKIPEEKKEQKMTVEKIRELYEKNPDITQKEIANILGVKPSSVSQYIKKHPDALPS